MGVASMLQGYDTHLQSNLSEVHISMILNQEQSVTCQDAFPLRRKSEDAIFN